MTTSLSPLGKPRPTQARLVPVDTISEEVADIFSKGITAGSGEPLNIFKTIAHHPEPRHQDRSHSRTKSLETTS